MNGEEGGHLSLGLKTHLVYCFPLLLEPGYAVTGAVRLGFALARSVCFQGQKGEWILGDSLNSLSISALWFTIF